MNPSICGLQRATDIESFLGKALETEMTKVKVITDSKESRLSSSVELLESDFVLLCLK